jgi:putative addiction module component (TIGR02574 family)
MDVELPLEQMTIEDKLRTLERIWDDLCRSAKDVPSPAWHLDVLRAREQRLEEGPSKSVGWEEAKRRIRDATT